jgi:23S rRNA (pseudouridine1915-N3)-methyltransferase
VKIKIAWIGKTREPAIQRLTDEYLKRIARYAEVEGLGLNSEAALLKLGERQGTRPAHCLILLDSRGKPFTSEQFARFLQTRAESDPRPMVLAIGPADGFRDETRKASQDLISLGPMTLAHELARIVLLEQVYRAFTILRGHPYHTGH